MRHSRALRISHKLVQPLNLYFFLVPTVICNREEVPFIGTRKNKVLRKNWRIERNEGLAFFFVVVIERYCAICLEYKKPTTTKKKGFLPVVP